ncbi:unnamed protein product, partial [Rotaria sordida]
NLIVDPKTLSRHIDRIYDERKCQLISLFQTIKSFIITVDFWKGYFTGVHYAVVEKLSDEKRPTIHLVAPLRQYLINCCVIHKDDEGGLISIKKFIDDQIKTMWISQDEHLLATILHPQLKHFD